jgi:GDPmannose 4,6-dehydratase
MSSPPIAKDGTNLSKSEQTAFVTGISGQDGSYLAELLLEKRYRVIGISHSPLSHSRPWIDHLRKRIQLTSSSIADVHKFQALLKEYQPREIYNCGARASSAHLFADPVLTAEVNGMAVLRMLEAIRITDPTVRFCQASSSEMFGLPESSPQNERTPFRPSNPYGVAKLFAHEMVRTYRENFDLFSCSSILFNHESPRRGLDLVTRKISMGVARIKAGLADTLVLGSLEATRDWGYAPDYVYAMWQMLQADKADDYVLATGYSHSVREFCQVAFEYVGLDYRDYVQVDSAAERSPEPRPRVGDAIKARTVLGWRPKVSFPELVRIMVDADLAALT